MNVLFTCQTTRQTQSPAPGHQPTRRPAAIQTPSSNSTPRTHNANGGARRDRTDDLMLAKHALSQLSYGPDAPQMVGLGRLELPTSRLSSARSNQLSYKPETQT